MSNSTHTHAHTHTHTHSHTPLFLFHHALYDCCSPEMTQKMRLHSLDKEDFLPSRAQTFEAESKLMKFEDAEVQKTIMQFLFSLIYL